MKSFAGTSGKRVPPSSYGGAARSEEGLDLVAALLDGSVRLEGFEVAPDLRWALVTALARAGRADADRVAEELARDNTISGQERAAAALAVIPSAETKAQAWADAALSNDVSNETQRSIAYVFDGSDQADVLEPYLEKYLAVADTIWEDQGTQIASTMLEYMFPRALTSRATLDRVDAWLETLAREPVGQAAGRRGPGRHRPRPGRPGRRRLTRRT